MGDVEGLGGGLTRRVNIHCVLYGQPSKIIVVGSKILSKIAYYTIFNKKYLGFSTSELQKVSQNLFYE